MRTSESIVKISEAYAKAQAKIESVVKNADNPFFKSKYSDLASVISAVKEQLLEYGITIIQPVNGDRVQTRLQHTSGEFFEDDGVLIVSKDSNNPQAQGSAITYARRYGLQSFVVLPAVDDDGELAMDRTKPSGDVMQDYVNRIATGTEEAKCKKCGAKMAISKSTGAPYCSAMCWKK